MSRTSVPIHTGGKSMQIPLSVSFRNMEHSAEIETAVREKVDKLEEFFDGIIGCRVIVEEPHHHHRKGNLYQVKIHLIVPHREIVVDREPPEHQAAEDVLVALRDAFKEIRRQLQDYARELRRDIKRHEDPLHGLVKNIDADEGWGMIETPDGREVYFHKNSVLEDDFHRLKIGSQVRFVEERGDKGPQASSVKLVGRHHHFVD